MIEGTFDFFVRLMIVAISRLKIREELLLKELLKREIDENKLAIERL